MDSLQIYWVCKDCEKLEGPEAEGTCAICGEVKPLVEKREIE